MRILITGYTSRMRGSDRIRGDYMTFSFLLEDILKILGHTVERRSVTIGEEITYVYDYAFVGVAPLNSMTAGTIPESHYVMDCLPGRHAVYADDWSFCGFGKSVTYALKDWKKYIEYKNFNYDTTVLDQTRESLERMIKMYNPLNNAPVLAPMFPWGNHDFLMKDNYPARLVTVDPSCFLKYHTVKVWSKFKRKKQWIMAALSNHQRWAEKQKFRFPVVYVGNRRMNGIVLTEADTVQLFAESFGTLSVGYPSAGSGWWRTRYLNSAWAETLIYSDPKDAAIMGEAYQGTPWHFESLEGTMRYDDRVQEQREWLESHISKKDEVLETIGRLIAK